MLLLTVGWYSVACMQAKSICISTYDGSKGGSALVMQAICNVKCMVSATCSLCWTLSML